MGMLFNLIGSLSLGCSLRTESGGIFRLKYITCLAEKRALNNLTSSGGAYFRFLFASLAFSWCPVLFSNIFSVAS